MQNNPLIAFLAEIFGRISAKSPKFFVIWQWIGGAVTAVSGLPALLTQLGVTVSAPFNILESKVVGACGVVALFMSLMPAKGSTVSKDASGAPLKLTNQKKLPFTAAEEKSDLVK